jgi:hypothetical protein
VYEVHVPLPGDPQRTVEAPVTEVEFYRAEDKGNPDARPVAEMAKYRIQPCQLGVGPTTCSDTAPSLTAIADRNKHIEHDSNAFHTTDPIET